jgi:hypothetical protein
VKQYVYNAFAQIAATKLAATNATTTTKRITQRAQQEQTHNDQAQQR